MPSGAFQAGSKAESSARPRAEALCGPEIVLLGDAWEHVQLERDGLLEISKNGDLVKVPQKLAALTSHLSFMQNRAVMVFGDKRETLLTLIKKVNDAVPRWNAMALDDRRDALLADWPLLVENIGSIRDQFPAEALVSSSEASFVLPPVVPTLQVKFASPPKLKTGEPCEVRFRLIGPGKIPIIPDQLHTTHTEKLHALLLDLSFGDYHHAHPQPTDVAGEYVFTFTPRVAGPYRMWLDVMPVATGRGEFPIADLENIPRPIAKAPAPSTAVTEITSGKFRARLEMPAGELSFGNVGSIRVLLEEDGKPLSRLEPLMGAFAHVVGFADDWSHAGGRRIGWTTSGLPTETAATGMVEAVFPIPGGWGGASRGIHGAGNGEITRRPMILFSRCLQRWWIVVILLLVVMGVYVNLADNTENKQASVTKADRFSKRTQSSKHVSRPRYRALGEWLGEMESIFGAHEAKRSRMLSRKETVDSELYLLAVEPPSVDEIQRMRRHVDRLLSEIAPENRTTAEKRLEKLTREYDPFGEEGRRVIQIDLPDEPHGRLTGFTCQATDFTEITERFLNGEMTDLQNLRGYAASYAGMPLTRFSALIVTDDAESR